MGIRRDIWHEALVEHLQEREWSDVQIINLTHRIGHSALLSCEGILEVLEYQQEVDEGIAAQKEHDRVFISQHEPTVYQPTLPIVERPDAAQLPDTGRWDVC